MKLPHLPKACTSGWDACSPNYRPGRVGCSPRTHLQDPAADVPVTGLALNAKLGMVVGLTVWDAIPLGEGGEGGEWWGTQAGHPVAAAPAPGGAAWQWPAWPSLLPGRWHSLADVLAGEDDPACLALKAADVPLLLQGQEGLALLDLLLAACAVWGEQKQGGERGTTTAPRRGARQHGRNTHICWPVLRHPSHLTWCTPCTQRKALPQRIPFSRGCCCYKHPAPDTTPGEASWGSFLYGNMPPLLVSSKGARRKASCWSWDLRGTAGTQPPQPSTRRSAVPGLPAGLANLSQSECLGCWSHAALAGPRGLLSGTGAVGSVRE